MKKILLFLFVSILVLTTVLISACGNNENPGEGGLSSSIENVDSSSVRPSRGSTNADELTGSTPSFEDPNESMSYTDPNIVSGSNAGGVYVEGDPFTVTSADPTMASINASTVIGYINMIGTIDGSNYEQKGQYIEYARQKYDALTASEKAEVINYSSLQGAESAYHDFYIVGSVQKFKLSYQALPDANSITKDDAVLVATLRATFKAFTSEQLAKLENSAEISLNLENCFAKLKNEGYLDHTLIVDDCQKITAGVSQNAQADDGFFTLSGDLSSENMSNDKMYFGTKNLSNCFMFTSQSTITFTTYIPGTLTVYCYRKDNLLCKNENMIECSKSVDESPGDDYSIHTFNVSSEGSYTLSLLEGEVFIFAMDFAVA